MTAWDTLFPLEVGKLGSSVRYSTDITVGASGHESRNANWQDPLRTYNASFGVKLLADIETLRTFFISVRGREQSFLIKDLSDYTIAAWTAAANVGDGARTTFQLRKSYVHGVIGTTWRNITKPKQLEGAGGVRVRVNAVEVAAANYSFSSTTGIITLATPPANGHVVDFSCDEFYVPVRFDIDELPFELLNFWVANSADYAPIEIPTVPLIEVRGE